VLGAGAAGRERIVRIADIHVDEELYPRHKMNWMTVYRYAEAMKAGAVFPPIVVGTVEEDEQGRLWLVDGLHRLEAYKKLGESHVKAIMKRYKRFGELFADAVKLNMVHGLPLSAQDIVRCIDKLKEFGYTREEISELMKIPVDDIVRLEPRIVVTPTGEKRYLKSIQYRIAQRVGLGKALAIKDDKLHVRTVRQLLDQLIAILEAGALPNDRDIMGLCRRLYELLGEVVEA